VMSSTEFQYKKLRCNRSGRIPSKLLVDISGYVFKTIMRLCCFNWLDSHTIGWMVALKRVEVNNLMSRWRPMTSDGPQGVVLGPELFNIFVGDMDSGPECTLSKSANDTKLCGAVNMLEQSDAIQRDIDRLESQACANLMSFNKAKCNFLHIVRGNPKHKYRLGREWIENSPEERTWGWLLTRSST